MFAKEAHKTGRNNQIKKIVLLETDVNVINKWQKICYEFVYLMLSNH